MAKKSQIEFKDLESFGFEVAGSSDILNRNGAYALDNIKNFLDEPAKEDLNSLRVGFRRRYGVNHAPLEYAIIDGNYIPVAQLPTDAKPLERVKIGVDYAFSFTQQEIGAMKRDDLARYQIVFALRDQVNKYCKNCMSDLVKAAKREYDRRYPTTKTRSATLAFSEYLDKTFATMLDRCRSAEARGNDPSADVKLLRDAVAAFKTKYDVE